MDQEQHSSYAMSNHSKTLTTNPHKSQISWTQPIHRARLDGVCCLHLKLIIQRGKWAARTISFELNGADSLPDGTPLGGSIVWNSKRLFPREQPGIRIIDIARVEHSDQVGGRTQRANAINLP